MFSFLRNIPRCEWIFPRFSLQLACVWFCFVFTGVLYLGSRRLNILKHFGAEERVGLITQRSLDRDQQVLAYPFFLASRFINRG